MHDVKFASCYTLGRSKHNQTLEAIIHHLHVIRQGEVQRVGGGKERNTNTGR